MNRHITIKEIINKLRAGELETPDILADYVVILSASLYTGGQMELETEIAHAKRWQELRTECKTDKECDMKVKLTPEYKDMQTARITNKTIKETIMSLKKKLMSLQFEYNSGQNY